MTVTSEDQCIVVHGQRVEVIVEAKSCRLSQLPYTCDLKEQHGEPMLNIVDASNNMNENSSRCETGSTSWKSKLMRLMMMS